MTTTAKRYRALGRCLWCGNEPVKGNALCVECARKRREKYVIRRSMNLCTQCGKPAQKNRGMCFECARKRSEYYYRKKKER